MDCAVQQEKSEAPERRRGFAWWVRSLPAEVHSMAPIISTIGALTRWDQRKPQPNLSEAVRRARLDGLRPATNRSTNPVFVLSTDNHTPARKDRTTRLSNLLRSGAAPG